MLETTVVVIGGGATGMGTLRDLSMRGVPAILLEQGGIAHGTSSRYHGLLHSGARYVVNDPASAKECIEENMILRKIGKECVEVSEGFFVLTPQDDPSFVQPWLEGCKKAGISAEEVPIAKALELEPNLAPDIRACYRVPDSSVDGFRLVTHNRMSAEKYGGQAYNYHKVTAINVENGRVASVTARDMFTNETKEIRCRFVINASGSWAGEICALAGLNAQITPDRGTLIAFNHRFTSRIINRLHASADGDIFVPHGSITILGTTSVPTDRPDDTTAPYSEVAKLLELGRPLFPDVDSYRILRAFAGTRPLYTPGGASGRKATRNFSVVDHSADGLEGMVSIFGGKLTTYRLMAERVCDVVCGKLGVTAPCRTADEPMVEPTDPELLKNAEKYFPVHGLAVMANRLGDELPSVLKAAERMAEAAEKSDACNATHATDYCGNPLLCECEMVSLAEIERVARDPQIHSLKDIRLRTRLGMGTCQGAFCAVRTVGSLVEHGINLEYPPTESVAKFAQERWKGARPALWGIQAREMEFGRALYAGVLNLDGASHEQLN
ncbi:MAG: anaerobic glycerol-3-phosphate dehydrogenase subunit A [Desulfovibrio sp.]|nr:anaerobic glycerol-3-phosphate dehydrogenase subunit A [Desulfovibrio sp.]